jgi:MOSC domain-containing protein YiiM
MYLFPGGLRELGRSDAIGRAMMDRIEGRVVAVCVGTVQPLRAGGRAHQTAFVKEPVMGPVAVRGLGLEGDEHIYHDHGGADQALLVYPLDHYAFWRDEFQLDLPGAGAFAENLTVEGLTETAVCIGDTFRIGEVVAQVTSPRTPCYKIGVRYDNKELPVAMQDVGNSGFLMRVIIEGEIEAGETMTLVKRSSITMTIREAGRVVAKDRDDWDAMERLIAIPELAEAMRNKLQIRLANRSVEGEEARLYGEGEGTPVA